MKINNPKVTVLMPVYNGEKHINAAVKSILNQTFTDFEFLIMNDGSTDKSVEIIHSYNDPRIKLIHNERNSGLIATLNKGLDLAQGEYIARMDCDDISLPRRLEMQVEFMDTHPEIGACGTWIKMTGDTTQTRKCYSAPDTIKCELLFGLPIAHPSTIIRKCFLGKYSLRYDAQFEKAEDYEFWFRCSNYFPLTNINKVLLLYRIHKEQTKSAYRDIQQKTSNEIRSLQIKKLGINPSESELELHQNLSSYHIQPSEDFLHKANAWLLKLLDANKRAACYPEPPFLKTLAKRWFFGCHNATTLGPVTWKIYWESPLSKEIHLKYIQKIIFFVKCLLRIKKLKFF